MEILGNSLLTLSLLGDLWTKQLNGTLLIDYTTNFPFLHLDPILYNWRVMRIHWEHVEYYLSFILF